VGIYRPDLLSVRRLVELLAKVLIIYLEIIVLAKKAQVCFIARLTCSVRDGCVSRRRGGTIEHELLEFLPRWLGVLYVHLALELLQGLGAFLLRLFLLHIEIVEEELIIVDLIEIKDGLFALMLLIFWYVSHLLVTMGGHPDELGN
jgi:hypothetical protein